MNEPVSNWELSGNNQSRRNLTFLLKFDKKNTHQSLSQPAVRLATIIIIITNYGV